MQTGHGDRLASAAEKAADSKGFERAARMGYVASGLLHLLIGVIALRIATGGSGDADSSGALASLAGQPGGLILLWICFLGCLTLALFQLSRVWLDGRGLEGREVWQIRAAAAGQAVTYAAIGVSFGTFAMGSGKDSEQSSAGWSARLLEQPAGAVLLGLVGLGIIVAGGYFVYKGATQGFRKKLQAVPSGTWDRAVTVTGTAGYVAKGLSLVILGILVAVAAFTADPGRSTGLDGALHALRGQPFGELALGAVGVGLMCYGLYTGILRARFAKL